ncbi:hypothetical protein Bbelb_192110 [Branchiostoma belcheri]|nr:hypothetical protein Bbelb_192110 [Branchiostoma belcheri]
MSDGEFHAAPDDSRRPTGNYEQACDVRMTFTTEHANGHTSESTDTDEAAGITSGPPSTQPRRARWVLPAIGLCALVVGIMLTAAALVHFHRDNTGAELVSISNQLETHGKSLQDVLLALKTWMLEGPKPDQTIIVTTVSMATNTSDTSVDDVTPYIHDVITDMRSSVTDQTSPELTVAISTKPSNTNDQSLTAEAPLASTKVKRKGRVGEDEVLKMTCPGVERIRVEAAMYGVRPDCRSGNSLRRVRNICQGRSACSVPASNAVFGDPCVQTYKYLEVEYTCTEPGVTCPAWTRWLDRDDPISFYDWESFTSLRRVYPREICAEPSDIQARVRGSHVPAEQTGEQFFFYSPQLGLACRTRDQKDRRTCQDYEVRFCCP